MSDNEPGVAYIKNQRHELTKEPHRRQPGSREAMDDALAKLEDKRAGNFERKPESDAVKASRLRNVEDGVAALRVEDGLKRESAEREAEQQRQRQAENAELHIQQAAQWHPDDEGTLGQIQAEVQEFEQAKTQLAQAQKFAKEHPDQVSAQQRADLQEANQRLLRRQSELQDKGAKVQQASQTKALRTEQAKLLRDVPELADESTREEFLKWAEREGGIPRDVAEGATSRVAVSRAFKEFEKHRAEQRAKRLNRARKPVIRGKGTPPRMTVDQARSRLQQNGSMHDALNLLDLQRRRNDEAQQER